MIEAVAIATSDIQLQPFIHFDYVDAFLFSTELIATILAFVIAFNFYKYYKISGLFYLRGFVKGFSFIAFAESLLAADVLIDFSDGVTNMLLWLRLLSLSYGFSLLAVSYYYKHKQGDKLKFTLRTLSVSAIPIMTTIFVILMIIPPVFQLPSYEQVDEYFRVFNMVVLAYVFKSALNSIIEQGKKEFVYIPAAYAVLWLGQYSALIFSLDDSLSAFIAMHIAKVIGLALFAGIFLELRRLKMPEKREIEGKLKKEER